MAKKVKEPQGHPAASTVPVVQVPVYFRVLRWFVFSATVGIAIGMLALMDQQLTGISWIYDGGLKQYTGRAIKIQYCMFSSSTDYSSEGRCSFAFAVAAVSLALSFIWSYLQTMRRNPFKHPKAKLADLVLCTIWLLFWMAAAIVLCVWADRANKVGSFLDPARNARNGLCVMAWVEFLLVAVLTATAALLFSKKCQQTFDKWEAKKKERKYEHERKRLEGQQAKEAQNEAAAVAAKQAAHHPAGHTPVGGMEGPGVQRSTAVAPAAAAAPGQAAVPAAATHVPVSMNAGEGVGGGAVVGHAGGPGGVGGGDVNPFK